MMNHAVYLNDIETAVPPNDIHEKFIQEAPRFLGNDRDRKLFRRIARNSGISHRYSVLRVSSNQGEIDNDEFYLPGKFVSTETRMKKYQKEALRLAERPVESLLERTAAESITHLVVASCTGFYAPGLDIDLMERFRLKPDIERTLIGFMGCYAAMNGLKYAYHIVRSRPDARVLLVNLELCTLHMQENSTLEEVMPFMIFADGCSAAMLSSRESGLSLESFYSLLLPDSRPQMSWKVGDHGFLMHLSREVPKTVGKILPQVEGSLLKGRDRKDISLWAVHPGGSGILDAAQKGYALSDLQMEASRKVLSNYGNMSSATIMFVLKELLSSDVAGSGCAMAFGPGLMLESMLFNKTVAA